MRAFCYGDSKHKKAEDMKFPTDNPSVLSLDGSSQDQPTAAKRYERLNTIV